LGFLVPFTVGAIAMPLQFLVGEHDRRQVFDREARKFAAMKMVSRAGDHIPETLGHLRRCPQAGSSSCSPR